MNNQENSKEDFLRQYINPEKIEKAPEGFTSKVMTRIQIETNPLKVQEKIRTRNIIPAISALVTLLLLIVAFFLPSGSNDHGILSGLKYFQNINFPVIKINLESIFSFNVPVWLPYLFIMILILTIFDRALHGLFHRDNSQKSEIQ